MKCAVFDGGGIQPDIYCESNHGISSGSNVGADLCVGMALSWCFVAKRLRKFTLFFDNALTIPSYLQRRFADREDIVMEGRDIGSVVFPDTPHKFYIDASEEVRAQRRSKEGLDDSIKERDRIDSTRTESPLKVADDAAVIDSSDLTIEGVAEEILGRLAPAGILPA